MSDEQQLENLVLQVEHQTFCKEGESELSVELTERSIVLEALESDIMELLARLRRAEDGLSVVLDGVT